MTVTWPGPALPQSSSATDALNRMTATIAVAHGLAVSGRTVDLAGLDAAAGMMCASVLDLPPVEGAALRPALSDLANKLSALAKTLAARTP